MEKTREYLEYVKKFIKEVLNMVEGWDAVVSFESAPNEKKDVEDYLSVVFYGQVLQKIYVEAIYKDMKRGQVNMDTVLNQTKCELESSHDIVEKINYDDFKSYEKIKNHLILRPLNSEKNQEKLIDAVYYQIGDVALALYINIGIMKDQYVSYRVPSLLLTIWEKKKEVVMEVAIKNVYSLFPPRLLDIYSVFGLLRDKDIEFMESKPDNMRIGSLGGTFITTTNRVNGAISIFMPGVAKRLGQLIGSDFYIGFMSRDAAVVHNCAEFDLDMIRKILNDTASKYEEDDYLSNKMYMYSREREKIEMIE